MSDMSIKKAAMINFIAKYLNIFIQIIYSAILARILTPDDFGIVAITTVFTTFFMLFADMGLGTAVIQNKTLTEDDISNIFSFTFYLAILLAIIFAFFSIPLSKFYKNDVYISIGVILSVSLFFNTINMIPNAILMKNKKFKLVGLISIIVTLICSVLTISLAMMGLKYYAIAINSVITAFFTFVWNYKYVDLKLKLKIEKASIIKVKEFSSFQFAFSIVNYFSRNLDNLLIGKFMGNTSLAYYDKAYKLMLYPVGNLTHVITPVLHPILSEHQDDKSYIYDQYMKIVKILSLLGVFITAYCFFAAKEIILIMFGEQWISSIKCFKILSISVWAQMITSSSGSIFQSLGNTRLMFISGVCTSIVSVIAILIGISLKNITTVAVSVTIAYNVHFFITYSILIKYGFKHRYIEFLKNRIPEAGVLIITCIGLYLTTLLNVENIFMSAIIQGIVGGSAYILGLLLTKQYKAFSILLTKK